MARTFRHRTVVLFGCMASSAAWAQVTTATLNGAVTDASGAAIPGAEIKVVNTLTGFTQTVMSNDTGLYSVVQLPPGAYSETVVKPGFKTSVATGITLTVGQFATVNAALSIGGANETIEVTANEALINQTNASISDVIGAEEVEQLPLNNRDPSALVLLSPGTSNVLSTAAASNQGTNSFPGLESAASAGGGRQGSTYYLLDGAPNMDNYLLTGLPAPNADATQEFRVITVPFEAQYGFSPNAVVLIQTKSGTNQFHGGAFEFIRNYALDAKDYFSHSSDSLKRNIFGGFIGGPIVKNKLFFFANVQDSRINATSGGGSAYVPTPAMLSGDFSGTGQTLKAGGTALSPTTFDPNIVKLTNLAFGKLIGSPGQTANGFVRFNFPGSANDYMENTDRLDYTLNEKERLFLRSYILYQNLSGSSTPGNLLAVNDGQLNRDYNETLGLSTVINDKTANSLTVGYLQEDTLAQQPVQTSDKQSFCWSKYVNITEPSGQCYLEAFNTSGFGSGWTEPISQRRSTWDLSDTFTRTVGKVTVSAGVDVHKQFSEENTEYPAAPWFFFGSSYTGIGLADYLQGDMSYFYQGAGELIALKGWEVGTYGQAQYKATPKLTITAGLRWDPYTPPRSIGGRGSVYEPGKQSTRFPNAPLGLLFSGDNGITDALQPSHRDVFEPRIGFNYAPTSRTAVRAGFGIFSGPVVYNYYNHSVDIAPFSPAYGVGPTFGASGQLIAGVSASNPWASAPSTGSPGFNPFAAGNFASLSYKPAANSTFTTPINVGASFDPNFRPATTSTWSLSVEQQLNKVTALHAAYVGSVGYHQMLDVDKNVGSTDPTSPLFNHYANPAFSQILVDESAGIATYNSLQVGVNQKLTHNLQYQSNFTWAKVLDESGIGSVQVGNSVNLRYNYGISALNLPLNWVSDFIYTTPSLSTWNPALRAVLGGWQVSTIYNLRSGSPFGIGGGAAGISDGSNDGSDRADVVRGVSPMVHSGSRSHWLQQYINPAAFRNNALGTFGDSGKNIFHTPRVNYADSSLSKNFKVRERYGLQIRIDTFNTFNHASFGAPDTSINDGGSYPMTADKPSAANPQGNWVTNPGGNFGHITSSGAVLPRQVEGSAKLTF